MVITGIRAEGLGDLGTFEVAELGRNVTVRGPSPPSTAWGDALEIAFAAVDPVALGRLLARWGFLSLGEEAEIDGAPFPTQARWSHAGAAMRPSVDRDIVVTIAFELDAVQFGLLRDLAGREPRLVTALGDRSEASLTVGLLFNPAFDAVAVSLQRFSVGSEAFAVTEDQRALWLTTFLQSLRGRFIRHDLHPDDVADKVLDAALSLDRYERFEAFQNLLRPLYGRVRPAAGAGAHTTLLADDRPLRRFGWRGWRDAALAATLTLEGAEIAWVETRQDWVDRAVEGDGSSLEQLFRVHAEGTVDPEVLRVDTPEATVTTARFPRKA